MDQLSKPSNTLEEILERVVTLLQQGSEVNSDMASGEEESEDEEFDDYYDDDDIDLEPNLEPRFVEVHFCYVASYDYQLIHTVEIVQVLCQQRVFSLVKAHQLLHTG